ncbi:MAG: integration host factor subunit beta [Planctomycetaceae bacterium]|nr:integration host factor subunit beta [Planctomycetaceae bacterium]
MSFRDVLPAPAAAGIMTKKEIVRTVSEKIGMTQLKARDIVQEVFDAVAEAIVKDGRIELRNFGVFETKHRAARKARNPKTGEHVNVHAKFVVVFKPGKALDESVQKKAKSKKQT